MNANAAPDTFRAMAGGGEVITGWHNKLRAAIAHVTPADTLAEMHRGMAQPRR